MPEELIIVEEVSELVVLAPVEAEFVIHEPPGIELLELIEKGETGAAGAASTVPGPQGPPGANGPGDAHYVHNQQVASAQWVMNHNLGKTPAIVIKDTAGTEWIGNRSDPDLNTTIVDFIAPFSGTGDCN